MSARIIVFRFGTFKPWMFHVERRGLIRSVSKRYMFKRNAIKAAKILAKQLKGKYVPYE